MPMAGDSRSPFVVSCILLLQRAARPRHNQLPEIRVCSCGIEMRTATNRGDDRWGNGSAKHDRTLDTAFRLPHSVGPNIA